MSSSAPTRTYRVLWNYAVADDQCRLIGSLLLAFLAAWALGRLAGLPYLTPIRHAYAASLAISLILLERHLVHLLRGAAVRLRNRSRLSPGSARTRTLIFGITPMTRLYRNRTLSDIARAGDELLLGVVARDRLFRYTRCLGLPVVGSLDDLEAIYAQTPFDRLVLTLAPTPKERTRLRDFASPRGVRICLYLERLETMDTP